MGEKLLPCPFCWTQPEKIEETDGEGRHLRFLAMCAEIDCALEDVEIDAERWNERRPPPPKGSGE